MRFRIIVETVFLLIIRRKEEKRENNKLVTATALDFKGPGLATLWRPVAACGNEVLPLKKPLLDPSWLLFHRFSWIFMILSYFIDFYDFYKFSKDFMRFHGFQGSGVGDAVAPCGV